MKDLYKLNKNNYKNLLKGGGNQCNIRVDPAKCNPKSEFGFYDSINNACCKEKACGGKCKLRATIVYIPSYDKVGCTKSYNTKTATMFKGNAKVLVGPTNKVIIKQADHRGMIYQYEKDNGIPTYFTISANDQNNNSISYKYENPKELTSGAYGMILIYNDRTDTNNTIAVKIPKTPEGTQDDIDSLNKLRKEEICNEIVIPSLIADKFVIMEQVSGTLKNLIKITRGNSPQNNIVLMNILNIITKSFNCLYKLGLYYTDIKTDNILYRCFNGNIIQIILGDIGSAKTNGSKHGFTTTYPPMDLEKKTKAEGSRRGYMWTRALESDIVWGIGIILLELLGKDKEVNLLYWKPYTENYEMDINGKDEYTLKCTENLRTIINNIKNEYGDGSYIYMLLRKTLTFYGDERSSLAEVSNFISDAINHYVNKGVKELLHIAFSENYEEMYSELKKIQENK